MSLSPTDTVSVAQLALWLHDQAPLQLLDVREPDEYRTCHLPNARLMPVQLVPDRAHTLDRRLPLVVYCHHGVRSAFIARYLRKNLGFRNVVSVGGGIHAWAQQVDPAMAQY